MPRSSVSSGSASSTEAPGGQPVYAVILAGGEGSRLWPLAGEDRPKPFLSIGGSRSLFRETVDRILPLVGPERILVVAGKSHAPWVRRQAPVISEDRIVLEEIGRNTAASVALAALWIRERHPGGIMVVLPSDHWIAPAGAFRACVVRGIGAARRTGCLVLIGVRPRSAETGFGYICPSMETVMPGVFAVRRFVEKPSAARAKRYANSGRHLWNSGMFVWRAETILEELWRFNPAMIRTLSRWTRCASPRSWRVPAAVMSRVPALPVDRAVLERSSNLAVVKAAFRWSDVGNWDAYGSVLDSRGRRNAAIGQMVTIRSRGCLSVNEDGLSVLIGLRDVAVVRSGSTILVCDRGSAQQVRDAVERLKRGNRN